MKIEHIIGRVKRSKLLQKDAETNVNSSCYDLISFVVFSISKTLSPDLFRYNLNGKF